MSTPQNLSPEELAEISGGLTNKELFRLQRLVHHVDNTQQQQNDSQTQMLMFGLLAAKVRQG